MTSKRGLLAAVAVTVALSSISGRVRAQTDDELKQARELFQEAYKDEQEKRFDQALDKFTRVAKVRESPSVRYRIGSVLEALGRLRESRDTFRALAAQKSNMTTKDQPIADSAAERVAALDKKIPHIALHIPENPPPDAKVTLDGAPVPLGKTQRLIELDPGNHVVQATATGKKPFEKSVDLTVGDQSVDVVFEAPAPIDPNPNPHPPPGGDTEGKPNRTLAYVGMGVGGALVVTGVALLLVREGDVSDIKKQCPGGNCPAGVDKSKLNSEHDQASLFGPLGIGCTVVGAVVAAAGVYLFVKPPKSSAPTPPPTGQVSVDGYAVRGGGVLGLHGSF